MEKIEVSGSSTLRLSALLTILLFVACPLFGKRKDDVVIMKNGDKMTGEIKSLEFGELVFKSSYMKDSVHLDWKDVATLQSQDTYIVGLSDGERVTGFIHRHTAADHENDFQIIAEGAGLEVASSDVIAIGGRISVDKSSHTLSVTETDNVRILAL